MKTFHIGEIVKVKPAYVGNGQYASDGHEGIYVVVGILPEGDYYLAKGTAPKPKDHWDLIVRYTRIEHEVSE